MAPSSTTVNVVSKDDARLRTILETKSLRFHIKTGDCKWECTVLDRATHEKLKAAKESSSSSITDSESSSKSASTISSH